jgi:hypothetical protein
MQGMNTWISVRWRPAASGAAEAEQAECDGEWPLGGTGREQPPSEAAEAEQATADGEWATAKR